MGIVVKSPFSGRDVKVRDQDLGRAVKDEEGRSFYVLPRTDGEGHFGSPTRANIEENQRKYDLMLAKGTAAREAGQMGSVAQIAAAQRAKKSGKLKGLLLLAVVAAAVVWAFWKGPLKGLLGG